MLRRPKITKRRIAALLILWGLAVALSLALTAYTLRLGNLRELKAAFAGWSTPAAGRTILIIAPHCDDETLAAGGLMRQATENGANVRVAVVTNGDGFRAALMLNSHRIRITPNAFVRSGYQRQRETFTALERLGIPRSHVTTLGYPDRGLDSLWTDNWRTPYASLYTRDTRSPYSNSFTPNAIYTGLQLSTDLKKLLKEINPDEIYIPHPNDQHPDHWATNAFVTEALYDLGWINKKTVVLYLVHRGDWPVPQGLHPQVELAPPAKLTGMNTNWFQFHLDPDTLKAKQAAVAQFRSQTAGTRRFLQSFVRETELFGTRRPEEKIPESTLIRVDGDVRDWEGIDPVIRDPSGDGMPVQSRPGADITGIYAAEDRERIYFRISFRSTIGSSTICELKVHPLGESEGTTRLVLKRGGTTPAECSLAFGKKDIELSVPRAQWGGRPMLVVATSRVRWYRIGWYPVDRTAHSILIP